MIKSIDFVWIHIIYVDALLHAYICIHNLHTYLHNYNYIIHIIIVQCIVVKYTHFKYYTKVCLQHLVSNLVTSAGQFTANGYVRSKFKMCCVSIFDYTLVIYTICCKVFITCNFQPVLYDTACSL